MTRTGKIARLPHAIRELLNERLLDGEQAKTLLEWLNSLSKVREVLRVHFGGRPINEQNLSEWRNGGFEDWKRHQVDRAWLQQLTEQADDLEEDAGDFSVNDRLSLPLTLALGRSIQAILTKRDDDPAQLRLVLDALHELSLQRRCDHSAQRLQLEQERWEDEQETKKDALYTRMDGETRAAEALCEFKFRLLRDQYEKKKRDGKLTSAEEARYQEMAAGHEEWRKEPRMRYYQGFYVERPKTESNSIKPNQTKESSRPAANGFKGNPEPGL